MPEEGTTTTAAAQDTTQAATTATDTATKTEAKTEAAGETLLKKPEDAKTEAKTDAEKSAEGEAKKEEKKAEETPAKVVPEKYEYEPPEGIKVDPATLEAFTPLAKKLGLSQEEFKELADWQAGQIKSATEANLNAYAEQQQTWAKEFKENPEFGGEKFDASIRAANEFYAKFVKPEELALIHQFGLGNFPPFVALAARAHSALMAEDKIHLGGGAHESESLDAKAIRMFPNSLKK